MFCPKFWCPKMVNNTGIFQFSGVDHLCLLLLPTGTTSGEASTGSLLFEGEGSETQPPRAQLESPAL